MNGEDKSVGFNPLAALGGVAVAGVGTVILFFMCCFVTVGKGEVGVTTWFGQAEDQTLEPGPHVVHPFKRVIHMNTQVQKLEEPATVPTKNGLSVKMNAVCLYRLDEAHAPRMAREVGDREYKDVIVTPVFYNAVREATAEFEPEALYTAERTKVEGRVMAIASKELGARGVVVESVMVLDPVLPDVVRHRIEAKVAAEQDAIRMQSVFTQKELEGKANKRMKELEAEAKVIEAKGLADAQAIIKKELDDAYLKYLFINALKDHNGTTIYVPIDNNGMPFPRLVVPTK
jgi:regulator of protease activity HflC (stomatin/prohibitin superfamily)